MNTSLKFIIFFGLLILVNLTAYYLNFRLDLTEDNRYSISEASENILESIEEDISIKIYLESDRLPAGFERLKRAIESQLADFKQIAGSKLTYEFIDPNAIIDPNLRNRFIDTLINKGILPTNILDKKAGQKSELLIFPYALINYKGKETSVLLLKGNQSLTAQEKLNQSYENVEYELITAIKRLTDSNKKNIGLLSEFTSTTPIHFSGLINALNINYNLFIIDAKASKTFEGLDALILPKPDKPIDDSTKYKIDQFVMHGGKVLFFMDGLKIDSIGLQGTFAQPLQTNLNDLLFKFGVRINSDLVKDAQNFAVIPMVIGDLGDKPNIQPMPYRYFPLINDFGTSLITKNLDMVYSRFASTIDTLKVKNILKTPLLLSSPYTKVLNSPVLVSYNDARKETDAQEFQDGVKAIAYLLEGKFTSIYKNRLIEENDYYRPESLETKILVCSDGDLIYNEIDKNGNPYPLGYDRITQHTFANKEFLLNILNYMIDDYGIINSKAKSVKIRPLDKIKTANERLKWQIINIGIPILLLGLFAVIRIIGYRKKYQ